MIAVIPINPGLCSGCETPIWEKDPITHRILRPLPNYREFAFVTHNEDTVDGKKTVIPGSERMNRHAICSSCINTLTDQKVKYIFERIRATWRVSMIGSATIDEFAKLDMQQVVTWDFDEKEAEKKYGESKKSKDA